MNQMVSIDMLHIENQSEIVNFEGINFAPSKKKEGLSQNLSIGHIALFILTYQVLFQI